MMKNISMGIGNIADNGCGVIATYNVMLSKSLKVSFNSVKISLILLGGLIAGGKLGISPIAMKNICELRFGT